MEILLRIGLVLSPVFLMVIIAFAAFFVMRRRDKKTKLKWQIEEMFERDEAV